jgi:hypothetical protein
VRERRRRATWPEKLSSVGRALAEIPEGARPRVELTVADSADGRSRVHSLTVGLGEVRLFAARLTWHRHA